MSESSHSPAPATDSHGFDPLEFWIRYKSGIQTGSVILLAAMAGYAAFEWNDYRKSHAAAESFAAAKSPEELSSFIKEHRGMPAAGNAALLLAGKQREAGQLDESLKTLRDFLAQSPSHPMAGAAQLGIAATLELQGKQEEALTTYRGLASREVRGFATPAALLRMARILKAQQKNDEAKLAYETLQNQFPNSSFAQEALVEAQQLISKEGVAPAVEAAPAPAPAPAR